jgi:outer membrane protein OmpA-like peptidoglycan-associated protein
MQSRGLKVFSVVLASASLALLPMGCKKQPPITLACNAAPPTVYQGESVTVNGTAGSISTKKHNNVVYSWSGDGVTGNGTSATVNTSSQNPGSYTVKGEVKEGKKGKEGLKPGQTAECSASYTVKQFEPPTVSCSANPSTIRPGDTCTITAAGVSPQNRPLTYSYSAASGTVSGSGSTATFSSAGAPTGPVDVTCKVSDDKGQTATADTTVTIEAPPPPPTPHVETLCSLSFSTDKRRPTRVNNEAKACLDEVALDLQKQADAKVVLVGSSSSAEKEHEARMAKRHHHHAVADLAAQRAVDAKAYLVDEKGIDPSRISVATSAQDGQAVQDYLVPAGADFATDVPGTTPVDESAVKAMKEHAHHAMKKMKMKM